MPTLFRRKSTASMIDLDGTVEETNASKSRAQTPSKREQGILTPKRANNGRRGGGAAAGGRDASGSGRDARRRERVEQREAMMRGEDWALLPRDRGPDRALVRDIVDSRRNASSYFFFGLLIVLIMSTMRVPILMLAGNLFFGLMLVTLVVDGFLLSRQIKQVVRKRLPKANPSWGSLYFYGIMRATSFRRMRTPRPRVKAGESY